MLFLAGRNLKPAFHGGFLFAVSGERSVAGCARAEVLSDGAA